MLHDFNARTRHCNNCDMPQSHCHPEASAAENWKSKASKLWDLVHDLARWIPRGEDQLYDLVTDVLYEEVMCLDGKVIECDGGEDASNE